MTTDFPIHEILRSLTASSNSTSLGFSAFPTSVAVLALLLLLHWLLPFDFAFFTESPRKYLNTHCSCTESDNAQCKRLQGVLKVKDKADHNPY